ncbi:Succinyl-diaminopimelate desuccinylase [Candidatus Terasakiella magnetica]|uniref:Succinyl-diaminopimelate desuccinylase n=1 Tax=Candidatus Terasakiella magnetica TaxID=1867952 RepID=A0A1C3RJ05_9PROT|nr:succinyl-diaminopimelate desuccinylase [Candidatus Terasakiella magnetica]SCA57243.1 Succinyl-diaminopimelate desuccinylase [Candidatus Terasakiella magnetica]
MIDTITFTQDLIRCPSVTPKDEGVFDLLQGALEKLGFTCHRLPFQEDGTERVENLYARIGTQAPNFCFAGHLDVVPVGDLAGWQYDPFGGEIHEGRLYGRGSADMKGAVAAFVEAVQNFLQAQGDTLSGSISFLITGDEEGPAINGTKKVLQWMEEQGEIMDHCLVGEPTNPQCMGEMMKVGRRGSINSVLTVHGTQGHVAYPHRADNPLPRLVKMLDALIAEPLDTGNEFFDPSSLSLTTIDCGNEVENVIPAQATAKFNIRYNNIHTGASLEEWIRKTLDEVDTNYTLKTRISGESFMSPQDILTDLIASATEKVTGVAPERSTSGGTSDARFITHSCTVAEFGLVGQTMHKVDENVKVEDLTNLSKIYQAILEDYFKEAS